jgi:hypothetical protein
MAANRKNKSAAMRIASVIHVLLICLFIGGSGVGYVWQKGQINTLGQQIKLAETRLEELRRLNKQRSDTLAFMRSPQVLDARVKELNLGLVPPHPDQIWRLVETPVVENRPANPGVQQLAARPGSTTVVR